MVENENDEREMMPTIRVRAVGDNHATMFNIPVGAVLRVIEVI